MSIKTAAGLPPGAKPMPSDKGTAPVSQQPTQTGLGRQRGQETEDRPEKQDVIVMQTLMSDFAMAIRKNIDSVSEKYSISKEAIISLTNSLADTGGRQTFDGLWGDKTVAALSVLRDFLKKISVDSGINPGKNYKEVKNSQNLIDLAKANSDAIANVMNSMGFDNYISSEVKKNIRESYDTVPNIINSSNLKSMVQRGDGSEIWPKNFDNIWSFYDLATSLLGERYLPAASASFENSLDKIAERIKDSSIFRIAQFPQRGNPTVEGPIPSQPATGVPIQYGATGAPDRLRNERAERDTVKRQQNDGFNEALEKAMDNQKGMTAAKLESALNWFYERARFIYDTTYNNYQYFTNDKGQPLSTKEEVDNASKYMSAVSKLIDVWNAQKMDPRTPVGAKLQGKDPASVIISRNDLRQIKNPQEYIVSLDGKNQTGLGRTRETGSERSDRSERSTSQTGSDSGGFRILREAPQGPLGPEIDLVPIMGSIPQSDSLNWIREQTDSMVFSYEPMRASFGNLDNIVESYRADRSYPKKRFAVQLFDNLYQVVDDIYDTWREAAVREIRSGTFKDHPDHQRTMESLLTTQAQWADAWKTLLNRKKAQATDWDVAMYDRQGNPLR